MVSGWPKIAQDGQQEATIVVIRAKVCKKIPKMTSNNQTKIASKMKPEATNNLLKNEAEQ